MVGEGDQVLGMVLFGLIQIIFKDKQQWQRGGKVVDFGGGCELFLSKGFQILKQDILPELHAGAQPVPLLPRQARLERSVN